MAISGFSFGLVVALALVAAILLPAAQSQASAPSPAPAPAPGLTSDGTSVDQGIAYVMMAVALVLTYLIHAADLPYSVSLSSLN